MNDTNNNDIGQQVAAALVKLVMTAYPNLNEDAVRELCEHSIKATDAVEALLLPHRKHPLLIRAVLASCLFYMCHLTVKMPGTLADPQTQAAAQIIYEQSGSLVEELVKAAALATAAKTLPTECTRDTLRAVQLDDEFKAAYLTASRRSSANPELIDLLSDELNKLFE